MIATEVALVGSEKEKEGRHGEGVSRSKMGMLEEKDFGKKEECLTEVDYAGVCREGVLGSGGRHVQLLVNRVNE